MNRAITLLIVACLSLSTVTFGVAADETQDIPANAAATGSHDALVAALTHAGLVETLQGDGPFTVFAPTDAAFEAAGINLDNFTTDEANATLSDILLCLSVDESWVWGAVTGVALEGLRRDQWSILRRTN